MNMQGRSEGVHQEPTLVQEREQHAPAQSAELAWPSRAERMQLIRDYQAQALKGENPHLANLELLDGDTMLLALRLRELIDKDLHDADTGTEADRRRFAQQTEMFLKCMRQIDRNARIKKQLAS